MRERLVLLAILVVAFVLRTHDIGSFFIGPDDGSYLHSAQIDSLQRSWNPLQWAREDIAWVGHLAREYEREAETYQHSYVHQFVTRYLFRFGCDPSESVRVSTALVGTLAVFFAWWSFATLFPSRRRVGLLAAALLALMPLHVFLSRTGWGQVGFTCFYFAYAIALFRVLVRIEDGDRRAFARAGWVMLTTSLLAFGYHEGVAPYIVGSGVIVLFAPWILGERERSLARVLHSRRTWTYVWSAIPVGAATLALALFSPFAQRLWFTTTGLAGKGMPWLEFKRLSLRDLVVEQRIDAQLTWILIALAPIGAVSLYRRERAFARYLIATALAGSLILFLGFGDGNLARIYMPLYVIAAFFAAEGLFTAAERISNRFGRPAGITVGALVLGYFAATTCVTLFGAIDNPLFVWNFYRRGRPNGLDYRHVDGQFIELLRTRLHAGDRVAVWGDKAAIFRLQDVGIVAREDYLKGSPDSWPAWVVVSTHDFEPSPQASAYELVTKDTIGRWSLYKKKST